MSTEGGTLDDGSDLYCVSSPSRSRLRTFAKSAAQAHLAVLVGKARTAAVVAATNLDTSEGQQAGTTAMLPPPLATLAERPPAAAAVVPR